jgi:RNA polymerase sigma factor (sigma-70 family)
VADAALSFERGMCMFGSFLPKTAMATYDRQTEMELLRQFQTTGDVKAFKKLQISLRPLIRKIVMQQKPAGDDITPAQLAIRASGELPRLLKNYDPSKGQLNTYITNQMQFLMQNAVKENLLGPHVPRPEQDGLYVFQQGLNQASLEFGPNPTAKQILKFAPGLGSINEVDRIQQYNKKSFVGDVRHGSEETGFVSFKDQYLKTEVDPQDRLRSLQMDNLKQLMNELDPQEKRVIQEYVFHEKSMTDVALSLGLSSSQVRKTITDWKEKVKAKGYDQL